MYQYADLFALIAYAVEVIHVVFARSHHSLIPNMTATMSTSLTSAPNMNL